MVDRTTTLIGRRARALRRNMTEPEVMLWSRLKGRVEGRPIFRPQYAYETVIFDFYCPAAKLVVEIDGRTHWDEEARARDEARDFWLAGRGIAVVRIGAGEIYRNLSGAADSVIRAAEARIRNRSCRA